MKSLMGYAIVQKFNLEQKYQLVILDEKNWKKGISVTVDSKWYTEGFRT